MKKSSLILPIIALVGNEAFGASGVYVKLDSPLFSYTKTKRISESTTTVNNGNYYYDNGNLTQCSGLCTFSTHSERVSKTTNFLNGGGLSVGYDFNDVYSIEGRYSRTKTDESGLYEITTNTFGIVGIARVATYQSFNFNILGSIGYANEYGASVSPYLVMRNYKRDGYPFGIGAETAYNLSESTAFALGAHYTNINQKWNDDTSDTHSESENKTNRLELYASMKYRF